MLIGDVGFWQGGLRRLRLAFCIDLGRAHDEAHKTRRRVPTCIMSLSSCGSPSPFCGVSPTMSRALGP